MPHPSRNHGGFRQTGLMGRLARDRAGNTFVMVAAAVAPLMALIGGGVDMGRSYLSESRLQQACDAGVLAARKKLGSSPAADGVIPDDVAETGSRFFNLNFRNHAFGTEDRTFAMSLGDDLAISGTATVNVPTTIMYIFGTDNMPISVECEARLNFSNTDVMLVLDTTGSMGGSSPDGSTTRIQALRDTVISFYTQLNAAKTAGSRIRFGFVPYSETVNVGHLLKSDWMVDTWRYQGRKAIETGAKVTVPVYDQTWEYVSGSQTRIASYIAADGVCPASTTTWTTLSYYVDAGGTEHGQTKAHGISYWCDYSDAGVEVNGWKYDNYIYNWTRKQTGTEERDVYKWNYREENFDVSHIKGATGDDPPVPGVLQVRMEGYSSPSPDMMTANYRGCIEERDTYEITNYSNVNLAKALDLDLDLVPTNNSKTQWRPMFHEISFVRAIKPSGGGSFSKMPVLYEGNYLHASAEGMSNCPAPAHKLAEMTLGEVTAYVNSLAPKGRTYHDIGMIWGGRLISPGGLFADENADVDGKATSRHLIFMTDGQTAPYDVVYGAYGIEGIEGRRWSPSSAMSLTEVVEARFLFACNEVRKRNITIWLVSFGTSVSDTMKTCAGDGHWYEANSAAALAESFSDIARRMGELRISK